MQILLEAGANPNYSKEGQGTALQLAAFRCSELIAKHLLEASADVNLQCEAKFDTVSHPPRSEFSSGYQIMNYAI